MPYSTYRINYFASIEAIKVCLDRTDLVIAAMVKFGLMIADHCQGQVNLVATRVRKVE